MLLNISDIVAGYGSFKALRKVSVTVKEHETVTILGANGAGKTTLIKSILGLVKIQEGSIEFNGERIDPLTTTDIVKKGIALCPEGGGCFPEMSVIKNLMLGSIYNKDKNAVSEAYKKVVTLFPLLEARREQKAGSLSGGERQMLAIGRALMSTPRLLLLDEPSLGLAPIVINSIFEAINRLRDEGQSIMLVEQNAAKSLLVADRAYIIELGEVIISGDSETLREDDRIKKAYLGI
ncbi:MAG TPA: ABC transporter ATP-binding protein [Desulfobacterales bacterium]|nr:ABC transporter ATP-binding protein [Desulfobacterales bacterium]